MRTYRCTFHGRAKGAIGIMHYCEQTVLAEDEEGARLKLYDTHEHIMRLQIIEIVNAQPQEPTP